MTDVPSRLPQASVIISSIGLDLREYREATEAICLTRGPFPSAMEYFEAMGVGATECSLRKVDQADVLVGIYAHRYGHAPLVYTPGSCGRDGSTVPGYGSSYPTASCSKALV